MTSSIEVKPLLAPGLEGEESLPTVHRRRTRRVTHHEKQLMAQRESLDFQQIDNQLYRDWLHDYTARTHFRKTLWKWLLCAVIGFCVGCVTIILREGFERMTDLRFKLAKKYIPNSIIIPYLVFLGCNMLLALSASLIIIIFKQPMASGSGLPEVKGYLNGIRIPKTFNIKTFLAKFTSILLSFSSGLALGPEGPMVHMGTMIASGFSQAKSKTLFFDLKLFMPFRNDRDKRDFLNTGAAAGMAAAFGAPIGAVLFALEETSSFWTRALTWRTLFCCMVATFTVNTFLSLTTNSVGDYGLLTFYLNNNYQWLWFELLPFALIGVAGGLLGALFVFLNVRLTKWRMKNISGRPIRQLGEVFVLTLMTTTIFFFLPFLFGCRALPKLPDDSAKEEFSFQSFYCKNNLFNDMASLTFVGPEQALKILYSPAVLPYEYYTLGVFLVIYFFLTCVTAGITLAAGIFVPNMLVGAAVGRLIGETVKTIFSSDKITPSIYAMIGSSVVVAGSTRLTISIVVILLELTGDTRYLLPLIIGTMIGKWIGDLFTESIYEHYMELKHIPFLNSTPSHVMFGMSCADIMAKNIVCFRAVERVGTILQVLQNTNHNGFPVVFEEEVNGESFISLKHGQLWEGEGTAKELESRMSLENYKCKIVSGLILRSQLIHLLRKRQFSDTSEPEKTTPAISYEEFEFLLGHSTPDFDELINGENAITVSEQQMFLDLRPYYNKSVQSIHFSSSMSEAYKIFRTLGLRHLVVVGHHHEVVGMITRKDLL